MRNSFLARLNKAIYNFQESTDCSFLLAGINKQDDVNQWVYEHEPFPVEDCQFFYLFPQREFFHLDADLLNYYDSEYFQNNTDWHRLWTLCDMGSRIEYGQCTCIEYTEINGVTVTVEVNQHGQNGLYFDNLKLFKSLDEMFIYYRKQNFLVFRDKKFYSHNDEELLVLYERHIASRI
jgi:hypothetical protein